MLTKSKFYPFLIIGNLILTCSACSNITEMADQSEELQKGCLVSTSADSSVIVSNSRKIIIAHRGNSANIPENTIPAFQSAVSLKADMMEFDVCMSYDLVPVIMHDLTLGRTTNVESKFGSNKYVNELTLAQLKELTIDGGYGYSVDFEGKLKIPTFEEVIDAFGDSIGLVINIKDFRTQNVTKIIEILDKKIKDPTKVWVETNVDRSQNNTRYKRWCTITVDRYSEYFENEECKCSSEIYSLQYKTYAENNKNIRFIQERGSKVMIWTVTPEYLLKEVINKTNVDAVLTDDVAAAIKINQK